MDIEVAADGTSNIVHQHALGVCLIPSEDSIIRPACSVLSVLSVVGPFHARRPSLGRPLDYSSSVDLQ